ncbi:MAG: SAM-dependent methyltransferase [Chitinophagaceae bacterium]|nr:MAG: SAM-dependent methyltransferase [Chitinophagaceae bacterium]
MLSSTGKPESHPSSYRDPSGYVFTYQDEIYRQVNKSFQKDFDFFISSGLYSSLVQENLLIPHKVIPQNLTGNAAWYTTLKPEQIGFISYPYEWTFNMLKDAASLTLHLALKALEHGMILKDATPFNLQFYQGRMVFIDSLSFEEYKEGEPWIAYRQFCENFIGPLALMHYVGLPLQQLLAIYPDGIPLSYVKSLLPFRSKLNIHLYLHVHLHASYSSKSSVQQKKPALSKQKLIHLLNSLQSLISSLKFGKFENVWGKYYEEAETRPGYLEEKKQIIAGWLTSLPQLSTAIDVGGNAGEFAALASRKCERVICADGEHFAVEKLYRKIKTEDTKNIIPLCVDFTNPSPAIGVNNEERSSFLQRASCDLAMGLALIHHLAIGKNISFDLIAKMFAHLGRYVIIEFVAKEDEKVKILLQNKKDVYHWYTEEAFLQSFSTRFHLIEKQALSSSPRTLYLMERL